MELPPGVPVLAAVGAGFLLVGIIFIRNGARFRRAPDRRGWYRVAGTIVDYQPGPWQGSPTERERLLFPVVRYALPDGSQREFVNPTTIDTGLYRTGVIRPVLVNPIDPSQAELASSTRVRKSVGCGHLVLGAFASAIGLTALAAAVLVFALTR